jgi:hypothetical protein
MAREFSALALAANLIFAPTLSKADELGGNSVKDRDATQEKAVIENLRRINYNIWVRSCLDAETTSCTNAGIYRGSPFEKALHDGVINRDMIDNAEDVSSYCDNLGAAELISSICQYANSWKIARYSLFHPIWNIFLTPLKQKQTVHRPVSVPLPPRRPADLGLHR